MSDKIYRVNSDIPLSNQLKSIDKLPLNPRYLDAVSADFDKLRRWARERRVCRCRVSRRDPAINDPCDPRYFENLFIDDSACELHATVNVIREIAASGRTSTGSARTGSSNDTLKCGCRPGDGVPCETASQLMDQMHAALSRPVLRLDSGQAADNWDRYERLRSWLGRHYEEGRDG